MATTDGGQTFSSPVPGLQPDSNKWLYSGGNVTANGTTTAPTQTDQFMLFFNYIINVYIDGLFCLFGYVGNILILIVIQKDSTRTSNSIFLQALAIFDSMFLTYVLLYVFLRTIASYTGLLPEYAAINSYIVAIVLPFGWTSQTCGIWLIMVIAIDRYIVVSYPLKAHLWCTPKNAKIVVVLVFISSALFNSPRWVHYYYVGFGTKQSGGSTFVSHLLFDVSFWNEYLYNKIYHISLTIIFLFIIPLTTIITLNARLAMTIKAAKIARQEMTNRTSTSGRSSSADTNVTVMLVVVISIFIICELPDFVAGIIGAMDAKKHIIGYGYFAAVKESLLVFNSAINFYIYLIFYKRFRKILFSMLTGPFRQDDQKPTPVENSVASSIGSQHTSHSDVGVAGQYRKKPAQTGVL